MKHRDTILLLAATALALLFVFDSLFNHHQKEANMARTKTTEIYEVTIPTAGKPVYVEAQGKQEARQIAIRGVKVAKLSGREVRDLLASKAVILDGSEHVGDDDDADPTIAGQQSLPGAE